jgi:hypothetical protein
MAKAFLPPKELEFVHDYKLPFNEYEKSADDYEQKLAQWCRDNTPTKSDLVSEIVSFPVADNYAKYMVFSTKPLHLIHVGTYDGYSADPALIRGLNLKDVRQRIECSKALDAMFSKKS